MTELATQTLQTVAREIGVALGEGRVALEAHVEQPDNAAMLERVRHEMHQVQGALRVLEIYGAALLAEEMEQVSRYLIGLGQERKNQAEALDALMRAMVQLPGYLERVLAGGRDLALVLLPLLNDLRAVRGSALLSEGTLLLLNLKSDRQAQPAAPAPGEPPLTASQWARRLRARFQTGLIGWIRGERPEQNLEIMAVVAARLEQVATQQPVFQLWWVVGALIEALRENGAESSISLKRLLGLADREMKRLFEWGEARYAQSPPVELLNNLLYYVARATSGGPRVAAVRASFRLAELLPVDESIEQERENLSAPSIKLMHTVAAAIREDLSKVKDVLDIFVRRGGGQPEDLGPQVVLLKKIGDTLGVLGLGELRGRVQDATRRLERIVAGTEQGGEATLVQVAAGLIEVEDHLDSQLVGLILPRKKSEGDEGETEAQDQDFHQVQSAVLRECVVNLARIKEYVAQNVGGTLDAAGFDSWPELMRGIKAGLLMLGKARAVEIIEEITQHLKRVMQPGGVALPPEYLDRLADAIVSLEYYIETLQAGRSDPWYMLDNARTCLDALAHAPERVLPTVPPLDTAAAYARTLLIAPPAATGDTTDLRRMALTVAEPPVLEAASDSPAHAKTSPDPELIRLFVDEATEEVARIRQQFPIWDHNPLEAEPLLTVQRSFHTLKGSGRMVNARALSEFAWAIENLLNRILDGTQQRSLPVLETLRAAVDVLPKLVADLESGNGGRTDVSRLAARAHALASGREPAAAAPAESAQPLPPAFPRDSVMPSAGLAALVAAAAPATAHEVPAPSAMPESELTPLPGPADESAPVSAVQGDPALREIYARETSSHVAAVRAWIAREHKHAAPHVLPEDIYRACHTLLGSSTMAEARHGMRLAEPINHWLRKSFDSGVGLDDSDLGLVSECMKAMETVAGHLDEGTGFFYVVHDTLRARIARAELDLDRRISEATDIAQISSVSLQIPAITEMPEALLEQPQPPPPPVPEPVSAAPAPPEPPQPPSSAASVPPAPSAARAPAAPVEAPSADFDPEIASIFSEEAVELLEASQAALASWNDAPHDSSQAAALRRPLHTLKGGARMAGIVAMGELSHELESLITRIESGLASGDEGARQLAQQALDELSKMRDEITAGRPAARVPALIARIQSASGAAQPIEAHAPAEEESQSEPAPLSAAAIAPSPITAGDEAPIRFDVPPMSEIATEFVPAVDPMDLLLPSEPPLMQSPVEPLAALFEAAPREPAAPSDAASIEAAPPWEPAAMPAEAAMPADATQVFEPPVPFELEAPRVVQAAASELPVAAAPLPPGREPMAAADRVEMARVSAELLDDLLNNAGEVSIARARLEQQLGSIEFNLGELSRTVTRLKEQLRKLEIETEAQILHRHEKDATHRQDFDPLELDRYSAIQQFSRALAESASDVGSIQGLLENLIGEAQNLLQQQSRTVTELQNGLMRTRMVSLQRHVPRLARIVRQSAADTGKRAELIVDGASGELDRQVLERMLPPFEHMLRNAVVHGIETPQLRRAAGKDDTGHIHLSLRREGAEVIVDVSDDGAGMNLRAIRAKGLELGLIRADQELSDEDVMQLILEPGFSTASTLTEQAGRGVGMDVVAVEVKKLGGALHMESTPGQGSRFTIRLPFTLAISHALVVRTGDEFYALPLPTVEGVVRVPRAEVEAHLKSDSMSFTHGGQKYRLQPLALYVGMEPSALPEQDVTIPIVLVRAGEHSTGLVADELVGSREIVVKPVGPQISSIRGISGATILGDGRIVVILDIGALVRAEWRGRAAPTVTRERADRRTFALVVDDSITVRRVTQRLLERNGMRVLTARDGMDAIALLAENVPDIILLDIEMPRMDGYEVAAHVRGDPRLRDVPIIMITSRVGEKHRARAIELGVDDYLGKPYQESQLLDAITPLVALRRGAAVASGSGR
ncbi:MAG TPA: Hpt domain-containing protein [Steroidobacteraceae bacterium]|jgi:chemosensory pili system protein ChpA (sensor histidine kinase/response regulator)|nr:Hpt domain-containing protein [Steroidobacteraceae bacterium]